ncbi:hypothetical protein Taro_018802, partial [Colocasia esculenta]|nr:hypothetical protein [Colocasia esculenta]
EFNLEFINPTTRGHKKIAVMAKEDSEELVDAWSQAILHMLDNGFFVCKLDSGDDLQRILEGFWTVRGHPMILRKWNQDLRLEVDSLQSIPLWISLHGLPLHLWTRTCIAKLCSTIGEPLYFDKMTAERKRLSFARACVLVSSMKELPDSVVYEDSDGKLRSLRVSYSWRPRRCTNIFCKRSVDTPHNGVDTTTQIQRQKGISLPRSTQDQSRSTLDLVLRTACLQNWDSRSTQHQSRSTLDSVPRTTCLQNWDSRSTQDQSRSTLDSVPRTACLQNWDSRSTQLQSRSTLDLVPRTAVLRFGTVCRHHHQGRSTHYGKIAT